MGELDELGNKFDELEASVIKINEFLKNQENYVKPGSNKDFDNEIIFVVTSIRKSKLLLELPIRFNSWLDSLINEFNEFINFNKSLHKPLEKSLESLNLSNEVSSESTKPDFQSENVPPQSSPSYSQEEVQKYLDKYKFFKRKFQFLFQISVITFPDEFEAVCNKNRSYYDNLIKETAPIYHFFRTNCFHYDQSINLSDCPEFDLIKCQKLLQLIKVIIDEFFRIKISNVEDYVKQLKLYYSKIIQKKFKL